VEALATILVRRAPESRELLEASRRMVADRPHGRSHVVEGDDVGERPFGHLERSDSASWGAQQRGVYLNQWCDEGYATAEGGWSNYDIHHVIPREHGGSNDFSNLVPVLRTVHQEELNPWWRNYGG
jgi:hypothetical protein